MGRGRVRHGGTERDDGIAGLGLASITRPEGRERQGKARQGQAAGPAGPATGLRFMSLYSGSTLVQEIRCGGKSQKR